MFSHLNDFELHEATVLAAQNEKSSTLVLLTHLLEVDQRKAYLHRGFSTLWKYVEEGLKYSHAQTAERFSALRLMQKLPDARAKLENEELTLTSAAKLGSFIRQEKKTEKEARELLNKCAGKTSREVERILLPKETEPKPDQVKPISQEKTRITIEVDEEFMKLLSRAKELGRNPAATPQEVFQRALTEFNKKREMKSARVRKEKPNDRKCQDRAPDVAVQAEPSPLPPLPEDFIVPKTRYIPARIKHAIRIRADDRCEYRDPLSHRKCDARTGLEFHHHHPFSLGGAHTSENISMLCRAHHRILG